MKLSNNLKIVLVIVLVIAAVYAWQKHAKSQTNASASSAGAVTAATAADASSTTYDYGAMNWQQGPPGMMETFDSDDEAASDEEEAFEASMSEEVYATPTSHPLPLDFLDTNSKYVRKSLRV